MIQTTGWVKPVRISTCGQAGVVIVSFCVGPATPPKLSTKICIVVKVLGWRFSCNALMTDPTFPAVYDIVPPPQNEPVTGRLYHALILIGFTGGVS